MTYTINFSTNASQAINDINRVSRSIGDLGRLGQSVQINVGTAQLSRNIRETFRQLNTEIGRIETKLSRLQIGGSAFRQANAAIGYRQGRVERGQMMGEPLRLRGQAQSFSEGSSVRLGKELQAAQIEASQLAPNTGPWIELQQQIGRINTQLQQSRQLAQTVQMRESLGAFAPGSLAALETRLTILKNSARNIAPDTTVWKRLDDQIQKTEKSIQRINKKPLSAGQRVGAAGGAFLYGGGLGGGAGSALGGIAGGLAGGVPGAFAGAAAGQLVDNLGQQAAAVATLVAEVNKSKIALAGVSTNVDDYNKSIVAATEISDKFLLPVSDGIRQFAKLKASVVGAGFSTQTTINAFNGIGAAIIATGGSTEDLNGALLATSQVFSKGKVSAEELRGQIGERLAGAFTTFAKSIAKTPQELDDLLGKGQVSLQDFIKFIDELNKKYGSTAELLAKAPENAGARLNVALQRAAVTFGGFFQRVGAGFQIYATDLLDFVSNNEEQLKNAFASFAVFGDGLFKLFKDLAASLAGAFGPFFGWLFDNIGKAMRGLARMMNTAGRERAAVSQGKDVYEIGDKAATRARTELGINRVQALGNKQYQALQRKYYDQGLGGQTYDESVAAYQKQFAEFKPTKFGGGTQGSGISSGLGAEGKKKGGRKKELQDYVTDEVKALQEIQAAKEAAIEKDASYSDREREIQKATAQYFTDTAIAVAQYKAAIADQSQYTPATRGRRMQDLASSRDRAKELAGIAYTNKLTGPFRSKAEEERQGIIDLQGKIESLKKGRTELSAVEAAEVFIKQNLVGVDASAAAAMQENINIVRTLARERQNLSNIEQQAAALAPLRNQLALAQAIKPDDELRLQLQQKRPDASAGQIDEEFQLTKQIEGANKLKEAYRGVAGAIGNSFGEAFKGVISGSMTAQQALTGFFQSIADSFTDMVAQMIAEWLKAQLVKGFLGIVGAIVPGLGAGAGSGLSNLNAPVSPSNPLGTFANGGIASGGFRAFASGGVVTGPTLGLVGEGRYNEAVIPLPDGKSVPVQLAGGGGGGNAAPISTSIVVNVKNGQAESQMSGNQGNQLARELEGAVRQVILKESRPGGLISSSR